MPNEQKYLLARDIYSTVRSERKYGSRGESVTLIADHGNVAIVQKQTGERIPVKKEDLGGDDIRQQSEPMKAEPVAVQVDNPKTRKGKRSALKKGAQDTLF